MLKALESAPAKGSSRQKLIDALNGISSVFFTDKGQKLYESGQSIMFDTPDVALGQFREALQLEDGNVQILSNIARLQLAKQDCDGALATLAQARAMSPYAGEPAVLELRTFICQRKFELVREKVKALPALDKNQEYFVQYALAQDFGQQKMWKKSFDTFLKLSETDPKFPEIYYHLSKVGVEAGREVDGFSERYVSLCKGLTPKDRKRYNLEPALCANLKEVEDELAKKNGEI